MRWWGDIGCGAFGDSAASCKGVEFTIRAAWRSRVWNSSRVSTLSCFGSRYPSMIGRTWPIARYHAPPKWEARGGFTSHSFPSSSQLFRTSFITLSGTTGSSSGFSFLAPIKFEPASLLRYWQSPRIAWKRLKASLNEAVSMESRDSRWIAREYRQENKSTHTFWTPGLARVVFPWRILNGPKTSIPQW